MGRFVLRRLVQAVFTILGVMLLTFVLFRLVAGDVTAHFVNPKLGKEQRVAWLRKNRLDLPMVLNFQRRLVITDKSKGEGEFAVRDAKSSKAVSAIMLEKKTDETIVSLPLQLLSENTPLTKLTQGDPWLTKPKPKEQKPVDPQTQTQTASQPTSQPVSPAKPAMIFSLRDGSKLTIDLSGIAEKSQKKDKVAVAGPAKDATCGALVRLINEYPENRGRLEAGFSRIDWANIHDSQFFWHLSDSVTFQNRSYKTKQLLLDIIKKRAKYSLAISVPAMAMGWFLAMVVSSLVAYYRGRMLDKTGVFICVLGMCIPYLVYMIVGQRLIFEIAPTAGWGLHNRANIFVPVGIAVVAGLGGSVRFYRTVFLDEINRDYVRTARAKGVPLRGILFRHVLRNCMLPILTSLVVSIPFLIMGSLLLEQFFGVPGLGSLMLSSVSDRDVPIISGLTFLTAVIYVVGLLITDVLYAVFDPRIRLR
ncbi:MAG: ABC transporter permease [Planctomycetota bacterium]|nr:ABC transporter permease [Planctomycetota bacterium]